MSRNPRLVRLILFRSPGVGLGFRYGLLRRFRGNLFARVVVDAVPGSEEDCSSAAAAA